MPNQSSAWLIETTGGYKFAIAEYELIEYVMEPERQHIPLAPAYASSILLWQEKMIPIIDFGQLIPAQSHINTSVAVLAYQLKPGDELQYMGIEIKQAPKKIFIDDAQVCDSQDIDRGIWQFLSNSWFSYDNEALPIINISTLASAEFSQKAAQFISTAPSLLRVV